MHMELDLVPSKEERNSQIKMEEFLNFKAINKTDEKLVPDIKVNMTSNLGTYVITKVNAM